MLFRSLFLLPMVSQVKEEIMEIVSFLRDPQRFLTLGARSPAGVLLVGAPGVLDAAAVLIDCIHFVLSCVRFCRPVGVLLVGARVRAV